MPSNWSFRFHNLIRKHSNSYFLNQEWNPTPGNIPHQHHCMINGIKRSEQKWEELFKMMSNVDGIKGEKLRRFWWNIHPKEKYWKK